MTSEHEAPFPTVRLFIGAPVPPSAEYVRVTGTLAQAVDGVKPAPDGTWHVTLRFLGEVGDAAPLGPLLHGALADLPAVRARIQGVGAFPNARRARVIWAGVDAPGLEVVARRVVEATAAIGQPPESRPFRAHVTLARLRNERNVEPILHPYRSLFFAEGVLDRVVLFRSILTPQGPEYEAIDTAQLKEADDA